MEKADAVGRGVHPKNNQEGIVLHVENNLHPAVSAGRSSLTLAFRTTGFVTDLPNMTSAGTVYNGPLGVLLYTRTACLIVPPRLALISLTVRWLRSTIPFPLGL